MDWGKCLVDATVPTFECIPRLFQILTNGLLALVGTTAIMIIIFAGIRFILARGEAKELETARKTFFYALTGLILVLLSFLIINLIGFFTGATCINQFGFTNCVSIPKTK